MAKECQSIEMQELVLRYVNGILEEEERKLVAEHLEHCSRCREHVELLEKAKALLGRKEAECLFVKVGGSNFGPTSQSSALEEYFQNPVGEAVLELFDSPGGSGKIIINGVNDGRIQFILEVEGLASYPQEEMERTEPTD